MPLYSELSALDQNTMRIRAVWHTTCSAIVDNKRHFNILVARNKTAVVAAMRARMHQMYANIAQIIQMRTGALIFNQAQVKTDDILPPHLSVFSPDLIDHLSREAASGSCLNVSLLHVPYACCYILYKTVYFNLLSTDAYFAKKVIVEILECGAHIKKLVLPKSADEFADAVATMTCNPSFADALSSSCVCIVCHGNDADVLRYVCSNCKDIHMHPECMARDYYARSRYLKEPSVPCPTCRENYRFVL